LTIKYFSLVSLFFGERASPLILKSIQGEAFEGFGIYLYSVVAGVSAVSVGFDTSTLNHKKSTLLQLHKKENP